MKMVLVLIVLFLVGCQTSTEQRCKFLLNEQEEYVEVCR